jgi:SAM-dependent methyltransferase
MRKDEAAQQVVELYGNILKSRGRALSPDSVILDFGCGSGHQTYEFLDAGFRNAFGYEVQNYIDLRSPSDLEHFRFDPMPRRPGGWGSMTSISWPDDTFDFVSASSVFEHVVDQELAYREIHRVLKPGGSFLNIFPSKWRPFEVHNNIPFGGVLYSRPYLRLWAVLGVRGLNQEAFSVDQVVESNHLLATNGVNYLSGRQIAQVLSRVFDEFEYVEDAFIRYGPGRSRHLAAPLKFLPGLRQLFRFAHTRVILSRKGAHRPLADLG